ncbi:MAG: flavohemoglobin expression-modulating QEGLA motif protein [Leptolyngbyaceae bacterium]|nr:flavohemoglobin expression-modulating QEGLA motif protein [Leptolyngbyaceae bacterium]
MLTVPEAEITALIRRGEPFEVEIEDGSFSLKIEKFVPVVCTAIHNGHQLRQKLIPHCRLTEAERLFEEDPYTGDMIQSLPITLTGHDSRYEYDLNRDPDHCVYEEAWGKQVWHQPLSEGSLKRSKAKHATVYRILHRLLCELEKRFGAVLLFDVHSYNYHRIDRITPVFNLGTVQIDEERWNGVLQHLVRDLRRLPLSNLDTTVAVNDVFDGKGYLASYVKAHHTNTLVFPLEIKKVYMDERTGESYPLIVQELQQGLRDVFAATGAYFARRFTQNTFGAGQRIRRSDLLSEGPAIALKQIDAELYRITHGLETLLYVNPINLAQEKRRFFARGSRHNPDFRYRQLNLDPYEFREQLYRLPLERIQDAGVQQLYRRVVDAYATKIDLLANLGSEQFLYNSLRYYGEPTQTDIDNARFILYAPAIASPTTQPPPTYDAKQVVAIFQQALEDYGFTCKVELSNKIVARAMVNNLRRTILVNRNAQFDQTELNALIHHELGVHMVTTINAKHQPLKLPRLGLPGNTHTQEGLAILAEYLSGNLTLERLKLLALRVIAVASMLGHYNFSRTYMDLHQDYGVDKEEAYNITVRVYRGGGFTKDFLYLQGLRDALQLYQDLGPKRMTSLLIGKTSFGFLSLLDELVERQIFTSPSHQPKAFTMVAPNNPELDYVVRGIR